MSGLVIQKSTFAHMLIGTFSAFAAQYPSRTAMILEKMLFAEDDGQRTKDEHSLVQMRKVAHLVMVLPEKDASAVLAQLNCFGEEEDQDFFDRFIFEMARLAEFDPFDFADALADFTVEEAAEPFYGIDRVRTISEGAFGTQRMLDSINRLTDMLTGQSENETKEDAH